ncbi:DMT family transporter [Sphingomonas sp. SFZ2018-12]|uniref:DMT family transporter n=1 Tax=Sphingomonas sp. SFZ2018-12 TaxID=2683197 RepID=UPI001F10B989
MNDPRPLLPFFVVMTGIAIFSGMDALMKELVPAIGVYSALLWRTLAALPMSGTYFALNGPRRPDAAVLRVHLTRASVSVVMALLFFWGLGRLPMAQAIGLSFIAPLLALILAGLILKERVPPRAIWATLVAFLGVMVIMFGQSQARMGDDALLGALAVLASALCYAWNIILMRQQALVAGPAEVVFYQTLLVGTLLLIGAPIWLSLPPVALIDEIVAAALFTIISMALMSWGYARAEASFLAPTEYTAFIWAALLGWMVFGEQVSWFTLAGTAMIIAGVAWGTGRTKGAVVATPAAPA